MKKASDVTGPLGATIHFRVEFEGNPTPSVKWLNNGLEVSANNKFDISSDATSSILTIRNVSESDNCHQITCVVANPLGKDSCDALIKLIALPKADKDIGEQQVSVGDTLKIKLPVSGRGPFKLKLNKLANADEAGSSGETTSAAEADLSKFRITEIDGVVTITLADTQKFDAGSYAIDIANESGSISVPFRVRVKAPPGKPDGPLVVKDVGKSSCTLVWRPPLDDGGSRVTHYIVEKRNCAKGTDNWIPYTDHCRDTFINVQGLNENTEYEFRVFAVNHNGAGEPLAADASCVIKLPFGAPSAPQEPDVNDIGANFVTLSWAKPSSDGGKTTLFQQQQQNAYKS